MKVTIDASADSFVIAIGDARVRWKRQGPGRWGGTRAHVLDLAAVANAVGIAPESYDDADDLIDEMTDLGCRLADLVKEGGGE